MAVLMTLEVPGGTTAKYDRTNEILGIAGEHDAPPGLITHVCGITDDGILVVDVWDSVAALDDFARNRLGAALEQAQMPPAEPRTSPVHNFLFGAGKESNVLVVIDMAGLHDRGLRRDRREHARTHRRRREPSGGHARRRARAGRQHPRRRPVGLRGGVRRVRAATRSARPPATRMPPLDAAHRPGLQPPPRAGTARRPERRLSRARRPRRARSSRTPAAPGPRARRSASSASASHTRSSSSTVSGGRPLITAMPWPATWLRIRWSRKSGTTTSCANRPGLKRSSSR